MKNKSGSKCFFGGSDVIKLVCNKCRVEIGLDQPTGSGNRIPLPMRLYELCLCTFCMSVSSCHPKIKKLLDTSLCLLLYLSTRSYVIVDEGSLAGCHIMCFRSILPGPKV